MDVTLKKNVLFREGTHFIYKEHSDIMLPLNFSCSKKKNSYFKFNGLDNKFR